MTGAYDKYTHTDRLNVPNIHCSVVAWMYKHIGGIQADEENPGFKNILVKPEIGGGLSCAQMYYDSSHGKIETHWYIEEVPPNGENILHLKVTVPINTTADVYIPGEDLSVIFEGETGSTPAYLSDGVTVGEELTDTNTFRYVVESGEYHFRSVSAALFPFSCVNDCRACLDCEAVDGTKPCHGCNPACQPAQQ